MRGVVPHPATRWCKVTGAVLSSPFNNPNMLEFSVNMLELR